MSSKLHHLTFLKCLESCDLNENSWNNEQKKIATHWDSFVSIYYFTVFFHFFSENNVLSDYSNDEKCYVILFASLWHVKIQLNLLPPLQEPLLLPPVLLSSFCLNRDILLEILRRELMSGSLLWEESRR